MNLSALQLILAEAGPPTATQPNAQGQFIQLVVMLGLMGVMVYFVILRPQSKKAKEHAALLKMIKPNDRVVTASGIVGVVVSVKEKTIAIRSAETKLEVLKSAISDITERAGESGGSESKSSES
jgi:preprotein translocase subunit YajC